MTKVQDLDPLLQFTVPVMPRLCGHALIPAVIPAVILALIIMMWGLLVPMMVSFWNVVLFVSDYNFNV